ncbi:hypothetical protein GRX03_01585 [Halovenus sp. WSH3]|uniref:Uncharacterized protein n=1 Tax=Halovenus carboxidivorans TaxID=2692199 RepID=A0A6B0T4T1_9EURY|nr:hypothetical protein [Halovenus carboxidivorans]MXR50302.1 hypothetical protein [Halovenus carboxidivorans]
MSTNRIEYWTRHYGPQLWTVVLVNALLGVQLLAAVVYGAVFGTSLLSLHVFVIPFIWTTVSVVTVWHTDHVSRGWRPTLFAGAVAVGYLSLFLWLSGTVGFTPSQVDPLTGSLGFGVEVGRSLGWGPVVYYSGEWIGARIIPYQIVGYLALSYLVYIAVLDVTRSASAGTLGLILCPGCAAAALIPAFGGIAGLSAALSFFVQYSYELATVMFVVAMGWLYYQPSIATLRREFSRNLLPLTAAAAILVGALHFFHPTHGFPRLVQYLQFLVAPDPRPFAFTLSGIALFAGVGLGITDTHRKKLYVLGIGLMLVYLLGYGAWHTVLGHGTFWPTIEANAHADESALVTISAHLFNDGYALLSKLLELSLLVFLTLCYRRS